MPRVLAEPRATRENTNQTAMTYGELCLLKISANLCACSLRTLSLSKGLVEGRIQNFCVIHAICG